MARQPELRVNLENGLTHDVRFTNGNRLPAVPNRIVPRALSTYQRLGAVTIEGHSIDIDRVSYSELENKPAFKRLINEIHNSQLPTVLAVSRLAVRAAAESDYEPNQLNAGKVSLGHPVYLERGGPYNAPISAGGITIPTPLLKSGARQPENLDRYHDNRSYESINSLENYTPETISIGGLSLIHDTTMEPRYSHTQIGTSTPEDAPIYTTAGVESIQLPKTTKNPHALTVVHPDALLDYWRVYGGDKRKHPQIARMVFPYTRPGVINRISTGQQGPNFTSLGVFTAATLKRFTKIGF